MVTATQCLSVTVPFCQTVTWTRAPHVLLPACLCGWVAAHSHRRTGHCVTVWSQPVKECVTIFKSTQSPPSLCGFCGCDCAHDAQSQVTQCVAVTVALCKGSGTVAQSHTSLESWRLYCGAVSLRLCLCTEAQWQTPFHCDGRNSLSLCDSVTSFC